MLDYILSAWIIRVVVYIVAIRKR